MFRLDLEPLVAFIVFLLKHATDAPGSWILELISAVDDGIWRKDCPQAGVRDLLVGQ